VKNSKNHRANLPTIEEFLDKYCPDYESQNAANAIALMSPLTTQPDAEMRTLNVIGQQD
jgi:hypothetical protein